MKLSLYLPTYLPTYIYIYTYLHNMPCSGCPCHLESTPQKPARAYSDWGMLGLPMMHTTLGSYHEVPILNPCFGGPLSSPGRYQLYGLMKNCYQVPWGYYGRLFEPRIQYEPPELKNHAPPGQLCCGAFQDLRKSQLVFVLSVPHCM